MISKRTQCAQVRALFSSYLDSALTGAEMQMVTRHLLDCNPCTGEHAMLLKSQQLIASLGRKPVPADLALRLKVALSRESQRVPWYQSLALRWQTTMHNFMLPATAGL